MSEIRSQNTEIRYLLVMFSDFRVLTSSICFLLLILSPSFLFAKEQSETVNKEKQIEQIENELNREKEMFIKFDLKEKGILEQFSQIEADIIEKRKILKTLQDKIGDKKSELEIHREKLHKIEGSLADIEDLLAKRLIAFYKNAKRGYLKVLLATDDLGLLNHNMKYLKVIMDEDRNVMEELAKQKADHRRELTIVEEQYKAVENLETEEKVKLDSLQLDLDKKVLLLAKIHREKEFYEVAVKELQTAADYMKDAISNFESRKSLSEVTLPSGFGSSKRKLTLPVKGKILRDVKKPGLRSFESQKGIYIKGPFGAEVKAVYPGRVEYSGVLKGYGQVIVINHGDRYFTISAYLLERKKSEGDTVLTGDVIGYVGESGLVAGPSLYFEIRKGEKNLNPLRWLKVN